MIIATGWSCYYEDILLTKGLSLMAFDWKGLPCSSALEQT